MIAPYIPPGEWDRPRDPRAAELATLEHIAGARLKEANARKYGAEIEAHAWQYVLNYCQARRIQLGDAP
ncbi:MAG: hypothetical protein ACK5XN_18880 [Bacteroidota bacterium]